MSAIPLRRIEGKYEILEKLGEGGMGAVYKVRHRLLDDVRVIKMMRPQLVADDEFKARFQREARVAIQLRHPNIAHLIDFTIDEDDGTAFIVMEFIDGMTLEEVLRHSGPPSLGLALEIAQQSLRAIGYLHTKGFVHRDISPDNLMLTADADGQPQVKLIDLGIAKVLDAGVEASNLTGTGIFLGKVRYSPPEQFGAEGAAMVDARGDLYSFGVVFYELLTGRYPIQGRDPSSLIAGHLLRPPVDFADSDPRGRLSPELRALVLKALAKEPGQRFPNAREIATALAALRTPGDIGGGDLKRSLTRLPSGTVRVPLTPPGSTQDRLNLQFGLHTTPSRGAEAGKTLTPSASGRRNRETELRVQTLLREAEALLGQDDFAGALEHLHRGKALALGNAEVVALLEKGEAAVRERQRAHAMAEAQAGIEAALARSDYRGAEMRLYQAEASFGEQEVFSRLHERLGDLRRQNLEARRRAERLAAAAGGIEGAFARGELDEADRLLSQAASTFGEEGAIPALRDRLEELRRAAREASAAALVESAVRRRDEDDLDGALEEIRRALEIDPDQRMARTLADGITAELARRQEAALQAAREAEIAALLARARERREADDLEGALEEARRVFALEAENGAARALVEEIEEDRRRREDEAQRAARLAAEAARIEGRLEEGDLAAAGTLLEEAVSSFGELEILRDLRGHLQEAKARVEAIELERRRQEELERRRREEEMEAERQRREEAAAAERRLREQEMEAERQRREAEERAERQRREEELRAERLRREEEQREEARKAQIEALLAKARERREANDLEGTLTVARRVFALDAENPTAQELMEELEAERRRREKEAQRAEQLAAAIASIDACLDREDPEAASRLLPGIVAIFGDVPALRERWDRIEDLRRGRVRERVDSLLAHARKLQAGGELEAALGGLREAASLLPTDPDVRSLAREVEGELRQRDEESRRVRELETALEAALVAIDGGLERGDLAVAARLLPAAVARFGGAPALRERWERLEALQRKARVEALRSEAESLAQTGHLDRAVRKLRQALELDPGNRTLVDLLAELSRR